MGKLTRERLEGLGLRQGNYLNTRIFYQELCLDNIPSFVTGVL